MRKVHARFAEFRWTIRVLWSSPAMFLTLATCHLFEKRWCESKMGMRICIMHFSSRLLRIFLATISFLEFVYGILLVLSRCCFHYIVENSILYKRDIQHFCIGPILFSENKIMWSVKKLTVKFYLAPGVRNRKFYLAPGMRNGKIDLAPNDSFEKFCLAVKGLIIGSAKLFCVVLIPLCKADFPLENDCISSA